MLFKFTELTKKAFVSTVNEVFNTNYSINDFVFSDVQDTYTFKINNKHYKVYNKEELEILAYCHYSAMLNSNERFNVFCETCHLNPINTTKRVAINTRLDMDELIHKNRYFGIFKEVTIATFNNKDYYICR